LQLTHKEVNTIQYIQRLSISGGGGPADYFSIGSEQLFKMSRPQA
jgi:hypothetical protein